MIKFKDMQILEGTSDEIIEYFDSISIKNSFIEMERSKQNTMDEKMSIKSQLDELTEHKIKYGNIYYLKRVDNESGYGEFEVIVQNQLVHILPTKEDVMKMFK